MNQDIIKQLDNLYIQIKLHHERGEFEKAVRLFSKVSELNKKLEKVVS